MADETPVSAEHTPSAAPTRRSGWRRALPWVAGVLLALDIAALLASLSFANVTQEGPAKRSLQHSVAILTEVDAYLGSHYELLRDRAASTSDPSVALPDFPIDLTFSRDEVLSTDRGGFRALLLARAANVVYDDGMAAFRRGRPDEGREVSGEDALRAGMDFLRPGPHRVLTGLTIGLAVLAALLAAALALLTRGLRGVAGLGLAVFLASGGLLITSIGVRFAFRLAADEVDDAFVREFLVLGQELTWAPIRNSIIFTSGGAILALAGFALVRWRERTPA